MYDVFKVYLAEHGKVDMEALSFMVLNRQQSTFLNTTDASGLITSSHIFKILLVNRYEGE